MTISRVHNVEAEPYAVTWIVDAPWAHPVWSQYAFLLMDLTTDIGQPPHLYLEGATHEFQLWALDPAHPVRELTAETKLPLLQPMNLGYQFIAASDEAARERIQSLVNDVDGRMLSPDTDFRWAWDGIFSDGVTLMRS